MGARPSSSSLAEPRSATTSRGTLGRSPGPCFTGVSTRRVLRRMCPRRGPRGPRSFREPFRRHAAGHHGQEEPEARGEEGPERAGHQGGQGRTEGAAKGYQECEERRSSCWRKEIKI